MVKNHRWRPELLSRTALWMPGVGRVRKYRSGQTTTWHKRYPYVPSFLAQAGHILNLFQDDGNNSTNLLPSCEHHGRVGVGVTMEIPQAARGRPKHSSNGWVAAPSDLGDWDVNSTIPARGIYLLVLQEPKQADDPLPEGKQDK
ncbi:hypothetical protein Taro_055816 [Colocasia esculenta]|uniref:Uncharacterized protein n=1 Tax=Colocasia esculenta TaxID=4460 RepID=A0A843XSC8_COLES|nr:hypothetical protein [Colocasia esculenta]